MYAYGSGLRFWEWVFVDCTVLILLYFLVSRDTWRCEHTLFCVEIAIRRLYMFIHSYATVRPVRHSAELGLKQWHLLSGPDLNQKMRVIIAANASSVCYTFRLNLCVSDSRWRTADAEPLSIHNPSRAEPSAARFRFETATCKGTTPRLSRGFWLR